MVDDCLGTHWYLNRFNVTKCKSTIWKVQHINKGCPWQRVVIFWLCYHHFQHYLLIITVNKPSFDDKLVCERGWIKSSLTWFYIDLMCMTMGESTSACVCTHPTVRPKLVYMYCRFLAVVSLLMTFIIMSTCVFKDRNNKKPKRNVHFWIKHATNNGTQPIWSRISHHRLYVLD